MYFASLPFMGIMGIFGKFLDYWGLVVLKID